jgi:hypothetical protein
MTRFSFVALRNFRVPIENRNGGLSQSRHSEGAHSRGAQYKLK